MQRPPIILLKEGTDSSQGRPQIISNINACEVVVDAIGSTLGPRGMDKLIVDSRGKCGRVLEFTRKAFSAWREMVYLALAIILVKT